MSCVYFIYYNSLLLYIGSTNNLHRRKIQHKHDIKKKDLPLYRYLNERNIEFDDLDWVKSEIELDKRLLYLYEGYLIQEYEPICNVRIAGRTWDEYYKDNKEYKKYMTKEWCKNNPERKKQMDKEYREKNKEKLKEKDKIKYLKRKEGKCNSTINS